LEVEGKVEKLHGKVKEKLGKVEKIMSAWKTAKQDIQSPYIQTNQKEAV